MIRTISPIMLLLATFCLPVAASASMTDGYADSVEFYYSYSGASPIGGVHSNDPLIPSTYPTSVSTDVVLGADDSILPDFLSLAVGDEIYLGFEETVVDHAGDDIFIKEIGNGLVGENAEVWVTSNLIDYVFLGYAGYDYGTHVADGSITSFDIASIIDPLFTGEVIEIGIVSLSSLGYSAGFDLANVRVSLPSGVVPLPATIFLFLLGLAALRFSKNRKTA